MNRCRPSMMHFFLVLLNYYSSTLSSLPTRQKASRIALYREEQMSFFGTKREVFGKYYSPIGEGAGSLSVRLSFRESVVVFE